MIKEALQWIAESFSRDRVTTVEDVPYWALSEKVVPAPEFPTLVVGSLTGLANYVRENRDGLKLDDCLISIDSPRRVVLVSKPSGPTKHRDIHVISEFDTVEGFPFGVWLKVEEFIIRLHADFAPSSERDQLLDIVSRVEREEAITQEDTGISQRVVVKEGITGHGHRTAPPRPSLRPYRTFREIEPVPSHLAFRLRGGSDRDVECALFEADGGQWALSTREAIQQWLEEHVSGVPVIA